MNRIFGAFRNAFVIPELRTKILITIGILAAYRLAGHVPLPGINAGALTAAMQSGQLGYLLGMFDFFVGGNLSRATIAAQGIMPYISASIIIQLLGSVFPYFQRLQREGEDGRRKINQYTRYGTVIIALAQGWGIAKFLENLSGPGGIAGLVPVPGIGFQLSTALLLMCGTLLVMWLGEQITEYGIGNGISLIIFIGIVARFPRVIADEYVNIVELQTRSVFAEAAIAVIAVAVVAAIVALTMGVRKIPVQQAKRVVGGKTYGGQSSFLPLRVNAAGVIPIIFAQSVVVIPQTILGLFPGSPVSEALAPYLNMNSPVLNSAYFLAIIFFTYFYTAIIFNPVDVADNMKKYGSFIPGIRPGKKTAEFIDHVLTRITLPGAIALAIIAIFPIIMARTFNVNFYLGGTGLLIVVGVALDTLAQLESHLLMRHYDGFMKKGRIRGRTRMSSGY